METAKTLFSETGCYKHFITACFLVRQGHWAHCWVLTRSLPRDVYIRRKNDHPGGQGRIYIRPASISFLLICQSPATDVVVVACFRGVFFVNSLIAAYSLGLCSLRKQFFYASRGFCPTGGKQRCGCSQMRHKLVRAVRLNAFETMAIEERAGFVLLKARATGMAVEIGWQRKLMTGAPGEKNWPHCSQWTKTSVFQLTVNTRLCRGIIGTNIPASSRVKHCESAVRRTSKQERCIKTLVK